MIKNMLKLKQIPAPFIGLGVTCFVDKEVKMAHHGNYAKGGHRRVKEWIYDVKSGDAMGNFVPGKIYHMREFISYGYNQVSHSKTDILENKKFVMIIKKANGARPKFYKHNRMLDKDGLYTLISLHHKSEFKKQRLTKSQKSSISNSDNNKSSILKKFGITKIIEKFC